MEADGHVVHNGTGDADTMIVACDLEFVIRGREVDVVADDTSVFVSDLPLEAEYGRYRLSVRCKEDRKKDLMVWKRCDIANQAGKEVTSQILFIHAWGVCNTTSATFEKGKTVLLKKIK